jgi:RNase P subunit RPR2
MANNHKPNQHNLHVDVTLSSFFLVGTYVAETNTTYSQMWLVTYHLTLALSLSVMISILKFVSQARAKAAPRPYNRFNCETGHLMLWTGNKTTLRNPTEFEVANSLHLECLCCARYRIVKIDTGSGSYLPTET